MKRNNPVQTPGSPNAGAAKSMNMDEINPARTYSTNIEGANGKKIVLNDFPFTEYNARELP